MSHLKNSLEIPFYLSGPMPCPYMSDRIERKLFARLSGENEADGRINAALTRAGFRRSHDIVYRPACMNCAACVPIRIPVTAFAPSRSHRRIDRKNRDLTLSIKSPKTSNELYDVFLQYQRARHADSDMAQMTREEFDAMLQEGNAETRLYQLRDPSKRLMGAMIADDVADGLSAVYSFFVPETANRSLGTQLILTLVKEAARTKLPYVYLGYWIDKTRKMAYKARFRPFEILTPQGWGPPDRSARQK